jgi:hypothetical protein
MHLRLQLSECRTFLITCHVLSVIIIVITDFCSNNNNIFFLAQQPNSGLGRLIFEVSISHTRMHLRSVGLPWMSDRPVA